MAKRRKVLPRSNPQKKKRWHAVPLKSSFMATAMLGFLISAYWVYPQSVNYGLTFIIVFVLMFIAALVSMTKAPIAQKKMDY